MFIIKKMAYINFVAEYSELTPMIEILHKNKKGYYIYRKLDKFNSQNLLRSDGVYYRNHEKKKISKILIFGHVAAVYVHVNVNIP